MPTTAEITAQLTGPGGPFEVVTEPVGGIEMKVYKDRFRSLREVAGLAAAHGDTDLHRLRRPPHLVRRVQRAGQLGVAAALRDGFGVGHGDRVAVLSANNPEWCLAFWGTVDLGAILVGLNGWWKTDEILYGLDGLRRQGAGRRPPALRAHRRRASTPARCPASRPSSWSTPTPPTSAPVEPGTSSTASTS